MPHFRRQGLAKGYCKLVFGTVLGVPTDQRDIGLFQSSSVAQRSFVFMTHSLSVTAIHLSPTMSAHQTPTPLGQKMP